MNQVSKKENSKVDLKYQEDLCFRNPEQNYGNSSCKALIKTVPKMTQSHYASLRLVKVGQILRKPSKSRIDSKKGMV